MENNKYNFDYSDFDPEKDRSVKNDKASMSHKRILGYSKASDSMKEHYTTEEGKAHLEKRINAAVEGSANWRANNREKMLEYCKMGAEAADLSNKAKEWRQQNPERFEEIRKMATQAWIDSGYLGSDKHLKDCAKGGKNSSIVNLEKGNIGADSAMSRYKMARNRKKWAEALLNFKDKEFSSKDAKQYVTNKQFWNILSRSNLIYDTGKRGGYNNVVRYYALNMEEINNALNASTNKDDYFGK